jgi:hypothetical protein
MFLLWKTVLEACVHGKDHSSFLLNWALLNLLKLYSISLDIPVISKKSSQYNYMDENQNTS